jgi:hypothetical protein
MPIPAGLPALAACGVDAGSAPLQQEMCRKNQAWDWPAHDLTPAAGHAKSSDFDVQSAKNYPRRGRKTIARATDGYYN